MGQDFDLLSWSACDRCFTTRRAHQSANRFFVSHPIIWPERNSLESQIFTELSSKNFTSTHLPRTITPKHLLDAKPAHYSTVSTIREAGLASLTLAIMLIPRDGWLEEYVSLRQVYTQLAEASFPGFPSVKHAKMPLT
jgi:hypothetical protein